MNVVPTFGLDLLCMTMLALLFGALLAFWGYRFFMVLLPVWGFLFGFAFGAQSTQYLGTLIGSPDVGFLTTLISWVVGFFVGLLFALVSYFFYLFAVGVVSFSFGYLLAYGFMTAVLGITTSLAWLVALVVGGVVVYLVLRYDIQKYAIIIFTALIGALISMFALLFPFGVFTVGDFATGKPMRSFLFDPNNLGWLLLFAVLAVAAIVFQIQTNRKFDLRKSFSKAPVPKAGPEMAVPERAAPVALETAAPAVAVEAAPAAAAGARGGRGCGRRDRRSPGGRRRRGSRRGRGRGCRGA